MKVFAALALLIATAVAAQGSTQGTGEKDYCDADYIVRVCLGTQKPIADSTTGNPEDHCYALQAVATCYNNCPNDPAGPPARQAAAAACANITTTSSTVSATVAAPSSTSSSANGVATNLNGPPPTNTGFIAGSPTPTSGHSAGVVNHVSNLALFAGIAGAVVAIL